MNRRGFLAGLVATPVVAAVPGVLARLAPASAVEVPVSAAQDIMSPSHGGGRIVINEKGMAVYDSTGVEIFKIGQL